MANKLSNSELREAYETCEGALRDIADAAVSPFELEIEGLKSEIVHKDNTIKSLDAKVIELLDEMVRLKHSISTGTC